MEEEYLINSDDIERIVNDYYNNNQNKDIKKLKKLTMNKDTYDYLMTVKIFPLAIFAEEIVIDDELEYDVIKALADIDETNENNARIRKPHHQSKYTKKKYVYKKKNTGGYKNK